MPHEVPFRLVLTGGTADDHQFQGYDGYMALAGFAWTLSLISNYIDTGKLRYRGDFPGRQSVRATAIAPGSIAADFAVFVQHSPILAATLGIGGTIALNIASNIIYDVTKRVISRNLGEEYALAGTTLEPLIGRRGGDLEALVAATEPAVRQSHDVIGRGAQVINIYGGSNNIAKYDRATKDYVSQNVEDRDVLEKDFSVAAFNANSGHGSVFDFDIGRTIPISMSRERVKALGSVFTWGLDRYANGTGEKISMKFWRILAMDGTPKKYIVVDAAIAKD